MFHPPIGRLAGEKPLGEMPSGPRRRAYGATNARQGEIVLKRPWQFVVFMAGLFASVALLLTALLLHV